MTKQKRCKEKEKMCSTLHEEIDLMGQNVNLTFEQKPVFTTTCGVVVSIVCTLTLILFVTTRSIKLFGGYDPLFSMLTTPYDTEQMIDLAALKYFFAVEYIEPKYGRLEVDYFYQALGEKKVPFHINMVDCASLSPEQINNEAFDVKQFGDKKWMCPDSTEHFKVRGSYGTKEFDYIKIAYVGCDLGEECASEEELYDVSFNYIDLKAFPDLLQEDHTKSHFKY